MKLCTQEEDIMFSEKTFKPRQQTLDIIRFIAYTYRSDINDKSNLN